MEACFGAHRLSRKLMALGHGPRLMPAKYVRPYSKGQKNDFRDAEAIAEAVQRPTMRFVPTKTVEQLDLQALHRVRERLVSQRTGVINQIRAFLLERGIPVRQGRQFLRAELPTVLATRRDVLSPRMLHMIEGLVEDWRQMDDHIDNLSTEIEVLAHEDAGAQTIDERAGHRPDHLQRRGGGDRHWRHLLEGSRFCRLARPGAQANLDGRSHHPRCNLPPRQSLSASAVRAGSLGRARQVEQLGAARTSVTLGCGWRADQLVTGGGGTGVTAARLERPSGQGDSGLHMPLLNSLYAALSFL
jgi:transposase